MRRSTDVFIAGGGPAGLAAAIALRRKGFRVTVADGAKPPIDKACGEGLMPDTLAALTDLGVVVEVRDGFAFRGVRFLEGGCAIDASFPGARGIGVRRPVLHKKMIDRAAAEGVEFLWETPVTRLLPPSEAIDDPAAALQNAGVELAGGAVISARWIIGADGASSRVRQWSGLHAFTQCDSRFAFRRHYRVAPWSDCSEVYWGRKAQAYVTQVGDGEICVALVTRNPKQRIHVALEEFPELARRLANARATSVERGARTSMHRLVRVTRGNVALLGDASGTVDAITGEGLCLSFRQAAALARALELGELRFYQQAHRRLARRPTFMARLMLTLDGRPALRGRVLRTFAGDPQIFENLLAVHVGNTSLRHIAATGARFGWKLLAT